jgi:hypothetical protein
MNKLYTFACLLLLCALSLSGQTLTSLNGVVTDPTGAAIPGARIVLLDINTNAERNASSDEQGRYQFPAVTPGTFKLTASKSGFSDISVQNLRLLVSTPVTLNLSFEKVGAVSQTIEVSADSVQLNTVDATLGNSFGSKPILQLPFEGRNVAKILSLQAGVSWGGDSDTVNGGVTTGLDRGGVVNGGKSDQSNITLDGVDVNDQQSRAAFSSVLRVTPDSVQEFRVTTTNANADASRGSGAQVALVTKSGTNELHGSAYHFLRNRALNANSFFGNLAGLPTPKLNRNIFGGSLGGPIKKNKLFMFGNAEGRRDSYERSVLRVVPSNTLRQGIASYVSRAGQIVQVGPQELAQKLEYAPGVNQAALNLFRQYPVGNDTTTGDSINTTGFRFNAPLKNQFDTYIAKLDYVINGKHTVFARGQLQRDIVNGEPQFPGLAPNFRDLDNSKGLAFGWNATLSSSLISTTRYGFTRQAVATAGISTYAGVTFRSIDPYASVANRPFVRASPTHNITQDFTYLKGAHSFQFGGSYRSYVNDRQSWANSYFGIQGNSSWMTNSGAILSAPWDVGSDAERIAAGSRTQFNDSVVAVLGLITQVTSRYNYLPQANGSVTALAPGLPNPRRFRAEESEMYFQDTWKVTRNLTLTGGVRYMYWPAIYETNGVQTSTNVRLSDWFDGRVANANAGLGAQTGLPPLSFQLANQQGGRPLYDNIHNWSPRLALAYSPDWNNGLARALFGGKGKTAIRVGWGMYYDVFGPGLIRLGDATALGLSTSLNNSSGRLALDQAPRFTDQFTIPQALVTPPPPAAFPVTQPNNFAITNSLDDRLRAPYTMRWNFSVQRELKGGFQLTAAYVASEAHRSLVSEDLATPTNLRDPASGQTWNDATQALIRRLPLDARRFPTRSITAADTAGIQPIAFWENMFPGLAAQGLSATQRAYQRIAAFYPDITGVSESFDALSNPAPGRLGSFAIYSPQFSYLRALRSIGRASYHSMQLGVRKVFSNGDQFDFNYTWAHSLDLGSTSENNSDASRGVIINPYNRRQHWASSDFDQRQIWNANYVYNLPMGKGKKYMSSIGRAADLVVGGWQLGGLFRVTTGLPVSVGHNRTWPTNYNLTGFATTVDTFVDGTNKNGAAPVEPRPGTRPNSGPNVFQNPQTAINAFGFTFPGEVGNRNNVRGDGVFNLDMNLAKNFTMPYKESHRLQLRWEVFNVTNTTRFDPLTANIALSAPTNFGKYTETLQPSRVMQFSLRYDF